MVLLYMFGFFNSSVFLIVYTNYDESKNILLSCRSRKKAQSILDDLVSFLDSKNLDIGEEPEFQLEQEWAEWRDNKWSIIKGLEFPYGIKLLGDITVMADNLSIEEIKLV